MYCYGRQRGVISGILFCGLLLGSIFPGITAKADESKADTTKEYGIIEISEPEFDFGYVPGNSKYIHNFVIRNVGDGPLKIVKVDPTCGCTTAPIDKSDLDPGEETTIRVTFDSGKIIGMARKRIKVLSDDPQNGISEVYIKAFVARKPTTALIEGPDVEFNSLEVASRSIQVKNMTDKKMTVSTLPLPDDHFAASLSRGFIPAGEEVTLTISKTKPLPLGKYATSLTVELTTDKSERFSIPITGIGYLE